MNRSDTALKNPAEAKTGEKASKARKISSNPLSPTNNDILVFCPSSVSFSICGEDFFEFLRISLFIIYRAIFLKYGFVKPFRSVIQSIYP